MLTRLHEHKRRYTYKLKIVVQLTPSHCINALAYNMATVTIVDNRQSSSLLYVKYGMKTGHRVRWS